jgi:hypothetical protein
LKEKDQGRGEEEEEKGEWKEEARKEGNNDYRGRKHKLYSLGDGSDEGCCLGQHQPFCSTKKTV